MNDVKTNTPSNNDWIKSSIIDIIISFVSTLFISIGGLIVSFLEGYKDIFPKFSSILCISLVSIILILIYVFLQKFINEKIAKGLYILFAFICLLLILFFLVHFVYISKYVLECFSQNISVDTVYESYKYLTTTLVIFLHCVIIYYTINNHYQNIVKNNRQNECFEEKNELVESLNNISQESENIVIQKIAELGSTIKNESENKFTALEEFVADEGRRNNKDIVDSFTNIVKKLTTTSFAITCTTIPVKIEGNTVKFFMITNTSYPDYTWMFPGGHINFEETENPDVIAISKAQIEAGLEVELIDVYNSFDLGLEEGNNTVDNMIVFNPPHYLNRFVLDENVKCYKEKGHKYHLDLVYITKIKTFLPLQGAARRICVELPLNPSKEVNIEELIEQECNLALTNYYTRNNVRSIRRKFLDNYVLKMLSFAYKDIIKHYSETSI